MNRDVIRSLAAIVGVVAMTALAACGGDDPPNGSAVNGVITVYSPAASELGPLADAFSKEHPDLRLNLVRLVGQELTTRLQSEVTSDKHVADVVISSTTSASGPWAEAPRPWFEPFVPAGAETLVDGALDQAHGWFTPFSSLYGVVYNTDAVTEEEVPRSWDELVAPKWKSKVVIGDPRQQSISSVAFTALIHDRVVDSGWMDQLAALDVRTVQTPQIAQSLTSGQTDLAVWGLGFVGSEAAKGAPLGFSAPTAVRGANGAAVLKGAPNSEGAKTFLSWLLTEQAQVVIADLGFVSEVEGSPLPEGIDESVRKMPAVPSFETAEPIGRGLMDQWKKLLR